MKRFRSQSVEGSAMAQHHQWILVVAVLALSCRDANAECTVPAFKMCQGMMPFDITKPTEDLTRADFDRGCQNTAALQNCVIGLACTTADDLYTRYYLKYLDTAAGYVYLCQPDSQVAFFANNDCLRAAFQRHQNDCKNSVSAVNGDSDRCRYINERAQCAYNWTMTTCSDGRVANLVHSIIIKAHEQQYEATFGCQLAEAPVPATTAASSTKARPAETTPAAATAAQTTHAKTTEVSSVPTNRIVPVDVPLQCDEASFKICQAKLPFDSTKPTENLTKSDFNQGCGQLASFKRCLESLKCTSRNTDLYTYYLQFLDTAEGYVYLCQSNIRHDFFANRPCLQVGFRHHTQDCSDSVAKPTTDRDRCRYIYDRAECAYNLTMSSCRDERVARLIKTLIITTQKRQHETTYNCSIARCKEVTLEECQAYIQLKNDVTEAKLLYDTKQGLDAVCSKIDQLQQCVASSRCEAYQGGAIDRYIDALGYICKNSSIKQVFSDSMGCILGEAANLTQCIRKSESFISFKCTRQSKIVACYKSVYAAGCGQRAADVIVTAHLKLDNSGCQLSADGIQTTAISYALVTCLAICSMLFNILRV